MHKEEEGALKSVPIARESGSKNQGTYEFDNSLFTNQRVDIFALEVCESGPTKFSASWAKTDTALCGISPTFFMVEEKVFIVDIRESTARGTWRSPE